MSSGIPPPETAIYWVDEPAVFEIRDGIGRCTVRSGGHTFEFRGTVNTVLHTMASASQAYAGHVGKSAADVVLFRRGGKR